VAARELGRAGLGRPSGREAYWPGAGSVPRAGTPRRPVVVGAGELGGATATLLAGAGFTVVAGDRTPNALDEMPEGIRREVGDTTDQPMAKTLIDRIAGEAAP